LDARSAENSVQGVCVCTGLLGLSLYQAASIYLAEMCTQVSTSVNRSHLRSAAHYDLAVHPYLSSCYVSMIDTNTVCTT